MTSPLDTRSPLDARLGSLYGGLDVSPGFDAGVMARVHAESAALEARDRARARVEEAQRYELARRRHSWGTLLRQVATPNTLGAVVLGAFGVNSVWSSIHSQAGHLVAAYAPLTLTAFGIALAVAAPLLLLQNHRRMSGLA